MKTNDIKNKEQEFISVKSIFFASYLYSQGMEPEKIIIGEDQRAVFYYKKTTNFFELQKDYLSDYQLQKFIGSYRVIKNKIYEIKEYKEGNNGRQKDNK
ncbi:MAG: DUF5659 domain-containing protein [Candidatus Ratteibacteria bacterium]